MMNRIKRAKQSPDILMRMLLQQVAETDSHDFSQAVIDDSQSDFCFIGVKNDTDQRLLAWPVTDRQEKPSSQLKSLSYTLAAYQAWKQKHPDVEIGKVLIPLCETRRVLGYKTAHYSLLEIDNRAQTATVHNPKNSIRCLLYPYQYIKTQLNRYLPNYRFETNGEGNQAFFNSSDCGYWVFQYLQGQLGIRIESIEAINARIRSEMKPRDEYGSCQFKWSDSNKKMTNFFSPTQKTQYKEKILLVASTLIISFSVATLTFPIGSAGFMVAFVTITALLYLLNKVFNAVRKTKSQKPKNDVDFEETTLEPIETSKITGGHDEDDLVLV